MNRYTLAYQDPLHRKISLIATGVIQTSMSNRNLTTNNLIIAKGSG